MEYLSDKDASHITSHNNSGTDNPNNIKWENKSANRARGDNNMTHQEQVKLDFQAQFNKNDAALEFINQVIETTPNYDLAWYWQGRILFEMKVMLFLDRKNEALQAFEKAIIINPNNDNYWYCKSRCLVDLYKEKEALKAIEKAIALNPNNTDYLELKNKISQ